MSNKQSSTISNTILKNIRRYQKEKGFSQNRLSKEVEVAYNTIDKIEFGENPNLSVDTLKRIANALNVPIVKLFKD